MTAWPPLIKVCQDENTADEDHCAEGTEYSVFLSGSEIVGAHIFQLQVNIQ